MTNEQAGIFIKAIQFYQENDHLPELDFGLKMAITPFINQFIRDEENYKNTCEARRLAGSIGGKQKVANASNSNQKVANLAENKNKNKNENKSDNKKEEIDQTEDQFEEFWNLYNYKKGKPKALAAYKICIKKTTHEQILEGVKKYNASKGTESKYWKHPTTWLNAESWNDEYTQSTKTENNLCLELNKLVGQDWFKEIDVIDAKAIFTISKENYELLKKLDQSLKDQILTKIKNELQISTIRPKFL